MVELTRVGSDRFRRFSSQDWKATNKQMTIDGISMYPSRIKGGKDTTRNSSGIKRIEYVPLNDFQGFVILTLKTRAKRMYKGQIKTVNTKGGQLTVPVSFKAFITKLGSPNNKPFDGVGRKLGGMRTFEGVGEGQGGESEHQANIVKAFKRQKATSGKDYEQITDGLQTGQIAKLQRSINRGALIKRYYTPEQLITMFLRQLRF